MPVAPTSLIRRIQNWQLKLEEALNSDNPARTLIYITLHALKPCWRDRRHF